jgi:chemotaxis protein CheX
MSLNESVSVASNLRENELARHVINATKEVFSTMVVMELEDNYPLREPVTRFHCSISGMVGLAGVYTGILSIHCPQSLALQITSNMLGVDVTEMGEDACDAMGEIANMLGGHVKQVFSKGGLDLNLSIPTVITGEDYCLNCMTDKDCVIIPFTWQGESFLVGLTLRKEH